MDRSQLKKYYIRRKTLLFNHIKKFSTHNGQELMDLITKKYDIKERNTNVEYDIKFYRMRALEIDRLITEVDASNRNNTQFVYTEPETPIVLDRLTPKLEYLKKNILTLKPHEIKKRYKVMLQRLHAFATALEKHDDKYMTAYTKLEKYKDGNDFSNCYEELLRTIDEAEQLAEDQNIKVKVKGE